MSNGFQHVRILGHPDFSPDANPFIVTVDTVSTGIGCTLAQTQYVPNAEDWGNTYDAIIAYRRFDSDDDQIALYCQPFN